MTHTERAVQKNICIALPTYTGQGHWRTFFSLLEGAFDLAAKGIAFTWLFREHDSMIARARSLMVAQFLRGEYYQHCTHLLFIDSDLAWNAGTLAKLAAHDVDVAGAAYPFKRDEMSFPIRFLPNTPDDPPLTDGMIEVEAVTPGFFLLSRVALEQMTAAYPELICVDHDAPGGKFSMLFDNQVRPDGVWDEGFVFCERWRKLGGKVWVDPDISMQHCGSKIFGGNLGQHLKDRREQKQAAAEREAAIASLQAALHELCSAKPIAMVEGLEAAA